MKRRKPDLMIILVILIGLGVLVTGFTQELSHSSAADRYVRTAQQ